MAKRQRVSAGYTCPTKRKVRPITDFFQNDEARQSEPSSSLLDAEARDPPPSVPLPDTDDDDLDPHEDEMSLDVEQSVTTSNVRPRPGSVSRIAHSRGINS